MFVISQVADGIIKAYQEVTPSASRRYLLKLPHNCFVEYIVVINTDC